MLASMAKRQSPPKTELDLNLLAVLDALLTVRSVTRAADRVGLSQSATSHALARLRDHFGDALLVRSGDAMVLTERASSLVAPIRNALSALDEALRDTRGFEPKRDRRTFTVAMSDYLGVVLLPSLVERIAREAPHVDLRIASIVRDVETSLAAGDVDLVLGMAALPDDAPGLFQQRLFDEHYVCLVRRGHPAAGRELTVEDYCALSHALIAPRGGRGAVDRLLAARGLQRRIAVQVPHWLVAPHVVARTDLVLTVAERLAKRYAAMLPLEIVPLPLELPAMTCWQRWHERSHRDAAHGWLRTVIADAVPAIDR